MRVDDDPESDHEDATIDRFMQGNPRAGRLAELCDALQVRIRVLTAEIERTPPSPGRDGLEIRKKEARHQLAVLRQEQAISQFVEESVRATYNNQTPDLNLDEEGY